jgi:anti-sigma B factor antagonist
VLANDLRISLRFDDDRLVFRLGGEIDASNTSALTGPVLSCAGELDDTLVVIDLTDVTFIDSSGLAALLECHAALTARGIALEVRNTPARIRRLFEVTGLTYLFG